MKNTIKLMQMYVDGIHSNYFLFCFGISADDLKGGHKACDIFLPSFVFSLSVLMKHLPYIRLYL
jgi:hypothetical protein